MNENKLQHSNKANAKSMAEMRDILAYTLELCRKHGASDAEVDLLCEQGFDVDVRMGDVEALSFHQKQGLSLEVYHGQRKGVASSTDLGEEALTLVVKAACDMAKISTEDPCYGLVDESAWRDIPGQELSLYHPWDLNPKQAIAKAIELEVQGRSLDARIVNSDGASVSSFVFDHARMNSKGFFEYRKSSRHGMSVSLVAKQGQDMQTDYAFTTARNPINLEKMGILAQQAASRVCQRLGSKSIPTQTLPVVFSNRVSAGLIGTLISAISGAQLYRKNSYLTDSLGKKIGSTCLHLQEYPFIPEGLGSACFDSDGIPTRENCFVEDGVLKNYVLGLYSARRLGLKPTGNADGTHNLRLKANAGDLPEILQAMGRGLLITELMGQGVNILTGDYSRGAAGFWVENGEIQYPVEGVTIAGNLQAMFHDVIAIGHDVERNYASQCGSIWIKQMTVAGS